MRSPRLYAALRCLLASVACTLPVSAAGAAPAATSTTIHASFQPQRLGARTALTLAIRLAGGAGETPAPVRRIALHLPAGLGIGLHGSSNCPLARLRSRGAAGCPRASLVGRGHAQLEVHAGSQTIPEQAILSAFLIPSSSGSAALAILGVGNTPLRESTISTAILHGDSAPYGSQLAISIPAIPTLVYEPDASFDSLTLRIGGSDTPSAKILVPRRCRTGGFAFAADVTFVDGSSGHAATAVRCR